MAQATPLEQTRAEARALAADVAQLDASIDRAVLRYAVATRRLTAVQAAIRRNERLQAVTRRELEMSRGIFADRATLMYKNQGLTSLGAVFSAEDFNELVDQLYLLRQVRRHDSETVAAIAKASSELARRETALSRDLVAARKLVAERSAERDAIREQLARRRALLADAQARVRRLASEARRAEASTAAVEPSTGEGGAGGWWPLIRRAAADNGVSASGMYRLMMAESGGSATTVGAGRYYGLFQYARSTWQGSWNPYRRSSITDGAAQIRATALALRLGKGPAWWPNTYPWAFRST